MFRFSTTLRSAAAIILLLLSTNARSQARGNYSDNGGTPYQEFYDELSPYGEWINDPQYGYVWVPDAGSDFRPYYSNGYWANSDYGNTWVSNYDWGWAPFHYGRWTYNNFYGWVWLPGNEWGPAWVSWRSGGGNYGWAPLGPGVSVSMSFGSSYYVPDYWWTFTPQQYILSPSFYQHSYGPRYNGNYIHQTTIINNTYVYNHNTYITGPRRSELEQSVGRPVRPIAINNTGRPGRGELHGNSLNIYRPSIAETAPRPTERPQKFRTAEQPIGRGAVTTPANPGRTPTPEARPDRGIANPGVQSNPATIDRRPAGNAGQMQQPQRTEQATPQLPDRNLQMQQRQQQMAQQQQMEQQRTRDQQLQQQRTQQSQMDQQRAQQMQQQRMADQQRGQQMQQQQMAEQQRSQQMQQQRMMEQQRAQQQVQQQRTVEQQRPQPQIQRQEAPRAAPQREMSAPARPAGGEGRERAR